MGQVVGSVSGHIGHREEDIYSPTGKWRSVPKRFHTHWQVPGPQEVTHYWERFRRWRVTPANTYSGYWDYTVREVVYQRWDEQEGEVLFGVAIIWWAGDTIAYHEMHRTARGHLSNGTYDIPLGESIAMVLEDAKIAADSLGAFALHRFRPWAQVWYKNRMTDTTWEEVPYGQ